MSKTETVHATGDKAGKCKHPVCSSAAIDMPTTKKVQMNSNTVYTHLSTVL
jgi:hypothetical protein